MRYPLVGWTNSTVWELNKTILNIMSQKSQQISIDASTYQMQVSLPSGVSGTVTLFTTTACQMEVTLLCGAPDFK